MNNGPLSTFYIVLDYLMEKYKSKMSITIGEKEWTSLITIRSTGRHTDQMYKCRKELLTELELYDEGKQQAASVVG